LRIPDIYENRDNQLSFARFLNACVCCSEEQGVVAAIRDIDTRKIKGLGPAAANLIYFMHPTIAPPFNTAIVKGYNALTGANVKLGRWDEYLAMRSGIVAMNSRYRDLLSNDLGAIAALLFDLGSGKCSAPPRADDAAARAAWIADLASVREEGSKAETRMAAARDGDRTHTEVQGWLRDLGTGLGFDIWVASNDRGRTYAGGRLGDRCLDELPQTLAAGAGADAVRLIDVLWLDKGTGRVAAAFEVEHTTSIYSGIVRLLDLALGPAAESAKGLFLVAPDDREEQVRAQLARPAFGRIGDLCVRFLPYSELEANRLSMARFGQGMKAVEAVARALS
jgi:type II restriction enzyme